MIISLIFTINTFAVNFTRNHADSQRFFIAKGESSVIELSRNNNTIALNYQNSSQKAVYKIMDYSSSVAFEWPYYVNSRKMNLVTGVEISPTEEFQEFVAHESQPADEEKIIDASCAPETENYYIIAAASALLLLLIESPAAYLHYKSNQEQTETQLSV